MKLGKFEAAQMRKDSLEEQDHIDYLLRGT